MTIAHRTRPRDTAVTVYAALDAAHVRRRVAMLAPEVAVIDDRDLAARPELVEAIEVAYASMPPGGFEAAPQLRWLQTYGTGVEGAVAALAGQSRVTITNMRGLHASAMAEHAFGMLLVLTRNLAEAVRLQQGAHWRRDTVAQLPRLLAGRTLGILGLGHVGAACARAGRGFGMRTIGLRRSPGPHPDVEQVFTPTDRLEFLGRSDVVINALPLTPTTRGVLGEAELAALPAGAIVVNVGRGATIDTDAIVSALKSGHLGGACLDVTDPEPLPDGHPLWSMPNVVITPHIAGGQPGYEDAAAELFADNLRRYIDGEPLVRVVDVEAGY